MPQLFDVPGWSVPEPANNPLPTSGKASKKRKRPTSDTGSKLLSAEFNLEKLMEKLKESTKPSKNESAREWSKKGKDKQSKKKEKKQGRKQKEEHPKAQVSDERKISQPKPLQPRGKASLDKARASQESSRPAKRARAEHVVQDPLPKKVGKKTEKNAEKATAEEETGLTALQKRMKEKLDGAKFRMINETLYKSDSASALQLVKEDPSIYEEYHVGFRHQVHSWPTNPVEQYIEKLKDYPPRTVIADLGCGDAALARGLVPEGMTVLSFDLISDGMYVVEADACKGIPLPGSQPTAESPTGEGSVVDVVVFSLSLMNTNWPECIREAWRILKEDGELQIAEVASRFTDAKDFDKLIASIGFRLKAKDDDNTHFTLFEFKKVARKPFSEKEWSKILGKASILKPCEYKRR